MLLHVGEFSSLIKGHGKQKVRYRRVKTQIPECLPVQVQKTSAVIVGPDVIDLFDSEAREEMVAGLVGHDEHVVDGTVRTHATRALLDFVSLLQVKLDGLEPIRFI